MTFCQCENIGVITWNEILSVSAVKRLNNIRPIGQTSNSLLFHPCDWSRICTLSGDREGKFNELVFMCSKPAGQLCLSFVFWTHGLHAITSSGSSAMPGLPNSTTLTLVTNSMLKDHWSRYINHDNNTTTEALSLHFHTGIWQKISSIRKMLFE